jgi:glycosyltransferase involved in cell wall biosynthesis
VKALLYTDLAIDPSQIFWHRDLGLLTKAFRALGHDAWLVVHPATGPNATCDVPNKLDHPKEQPCVAPQGLPRLSVAGQPSHSSNDPIIWASPSDVRSPSWWQQHRPGLIILGLWTRPKYDPIRRAALSATPRVIERADSDGMRTASCGLRTYARRRYDYFRDRTYRWPAVLSSPTSFLYSFASILATPWIEARLARTLRLLPAVAVETPHAMRRWKALAARLGSDSGRLYCIPHAIQTEIFRPDSSVLKKKQVISVGRWESYQKNLPLLLKTLISFLSGQQDWSALVVGSGLPPRPPHPQITFSPPLAADLLARHMNASRVFLATSRYESFGLAAAEARACGCCLVSPGPAPWDEMDPPTGPNESLEQRLLSCARGGLPVGNPSSWAKDLAPTVVASQFLNW